MCSCVCINSYCLLGDYVYGRILLLKFYLLRCTYTVNVVFVKLFVQCSELNLCQKMAPFKIIKNSLFSSSTSNYFIP